MRKFPNRVIERAYHSAQGKVFHKKTTDATYIDQDGDTDYNHVALNWLEDHGILERELNRSWVFEYRIAK